MAKLSPDIVNFFQRQNFVVAATLDNDFSIHTACKGIVEITQSGSIFLLDLYAGRTYQNLRTSPQISVTAVDEHKFKGYCLKGKAQIIKEKDIQPHIFKIWEAKITDRLIKRLLKNIREEKGQSAHPESMFPKPQYLIVMEVEEIVDLTPHNLRTKDR